MDVLDGSPELLTSLTGRTVDPWQRRFQIDSEILSLDQ